MLSRRWREKGSITKLPPQSCGGKTKKADEIHRLLQNYLNR